MNEDQLIDRSDCVICKSTNIEQFTILKQVPLYMGTAHDYSDKKVNQEWGICVDCGGIQLTRIIKPEILYRWSHTPGISGDIWSRHHSEFANFVVKHTPSKILEIGAGNMKLANLITESDSSIEYLVMDPNVNDQYISPQIQVLREYFDHNVSEYNIEVDTIIHSHTMEHFNNVVDDLTNIRKLLPIGGLMCFSVPLIDKFLERGWTNGINFEHTYLTTEQNINYLVESTGFEIVETYWFSDHNIFVACRKVDTIPSVDVTNAFDANYRLFENYWESLRLDAGAINATLSTLPAPHFVFGGHVFTQTLLHMGLNIDSILCILDNDSNKQGKRLYGTSLRIESPAVIESLESPVVVVRAAQYTQEIVNGLKERNPTVIIV